MLIAALILLVIALLIISIYNNLIRKQNAIDNAFHSIDVMLKKRYDLIPRLVETVSGYMKHEREVLQQLTQLRAEAVNTSAPINNRVQLDNAITDVLQRIVVNFENYPDLKASQNFLNLQGALNETEEQLAASRRFYNAAVNDYHNAIQTFPSSIIAGMMNLKRKNYFTIKEEEKAVPSITI